MEQPLTPKSPSSNSSTTTTTSNSNKKRPPTPEEVLAHYESQGLDSRAASLKAISDLQTLLFRSVASSSSSSSSSARGKKDRLLTDKLDKANTRLAILEMKLDSKPSFPESIAIGVTSGAILRAIGSAAPHLARIWDSVNSATNTSHS